MVIQWANEAKTYIRVEIMGTVYQIPTDGSQPDWKNIKAMVDAGTLVIAPYQPPAPPPNTDS